MNWKLSGSGFQVSAVDAPTVLLTRVMFKLKRTPEPESAVKSLENAEIRNVRIGPEPGITLPDTFQLLAVKPAGETGGFWKVMIVSSKVKSPWKATRLSAGLIVVVVTG